MLGETGRGNFWNEHRNGSPLFTWMDAATQSFWKQETIIINGSHQGQPPRHTASRFSKNSTNFLLQKFSDDEEKPYLCRQLKTKIRKRFPSPHAWEPLYIKGKAKTQKLKNSTNSFWLNYRVSFFDSFIWRIFGGNRKNKYLCAI